MKTLILTLLLTAGILAVNAQTLAPSEIPAAARAHFDNTHPEPQYSPDWKKVGDTYVVEYELHFVPNFNTYDANGNFLNTKTKTLVKFFPKCVKDQLYGQYTGKMKHAEVVTDNENRTYYVVEVNGNKLQFDNQCKLVSESAAPTRTKEVITFR